MERIALIADTHIPDRERTIPTEFRDRIADADQVIHAGDFTSLETLETVRELADSAFLAVRGNMDPADLDLPPVATRAVEGRTFVVTHGTGGPSGYTERVADVVEREVERPEEALGVAGHIHAVVDTSVRGIRVLNPGSVSGARPAERATMMTVDVDGRETTVQVHRSDR